MSAQLWLASAECTGLEFGCDSDSDDPTLHTLGRDFALDGEALVISLAFVGPAPASKEYGDWATAVASVQLALEPILARESVRAPPTSKEILADNGAATSWIDVAVGAAFDCIERGAIDDAVTVYTEAAAARGLVNFDPHEAVSLQAVLRRCRSPELRPIDRLQALNREFRDLARGGEPRRLPPPTDIARAPAAGAFRGRARCVIVREGRRSTHAQVRVVYSLRVGSVTAPSERLGEALLLVATLDPVASPRLELDRSVIDAQLESRQTRSWARERERGRRGGQVLVSAALVRPFRIVEPLRVSSIDVATGTSCCISVQLENHHDALPVTVHDVHFHLPSISRSHHPVIAASTASSAASAASSAMDDAAAAISPATAAAIADSIAVSRRCTARMERDTLPFTLQPGEAHALVICVESAAAVRTIVESPLSVSWSAQPGPGAEGAEGAEVEEGGAGSSSTARGAGAPPRRVLSECLIPWGGVRNAVAAPTPHVARLLQPALAAPLASSVPPRTVDAFPFSTAAAISERPLLIALSCASDPVPVLTVFTAEVSVTNSGAVATKAVVLTLAAAQQQQWRHESESKRSLVCLEGSLHIDALEPNDSLSRTIHLTAMRSGLSDVSSVFAASFGRGAAASGEEEGGGGLFARPPAPCLVIVEARNLDTIGLL